MCARSTESMYGIRTRYFGGDSIPEMLCRRENHPLFPPMKRTEYVLMVLKKGAYTKINL